MHMCYNNPKHTGSDLQELQLARMFWLILYIDYTNNYYLAINITMTDNILEIQAAQE